MTDGAARVAGSLPEGFIIYIDDHLVVVNKPAGLPTLPDGYDPQAPYVGGLLAAAIGQVLFVHRLDRWTSGVLLLARDAPTHRHLNIQFEQRSVEKIYHALVAGQSEWEEKLVRLSLRLDGDRRHRTVVDPRRGKPAETAFRVLQRYRSHTLLEAIPHTGRTHQIRAHLASLGLPLVGDALYGGEALFRSSLRPLKTRRSREWEYQEQPLLDRPALHAWSLSFDHPESGERLRFEAEYPKDLAFALRFLSNLK